MIPRVRLAVGLTLTIAVVAGLAGDIVAPRGPTTTGNALLLMAGAFVVGGVAGVLVGLRWILIPLVIDELAGGELGRLDLTAATLDVRLDNAFGILALVLTRGLHGLLVIPPLVSGVLVGGLVRRQREPPPPSARHRPVGVAVFGSITIGLAILVAWPASTPVVVGPDGAAIRGSIAELATVRVGGTGPTLRVPPAHRQPTALP